MNSVNELRLIKFIVITNETNTKGLKNTGRPLSHNSLIERFLLYTFNPTPKEKKKIFLGVL